MASIAQIARCRCGYTRQGKRNDKAKCPKCNKLLRWGSYIARINKDGRTMTKSFKLRKDAELFLSQCHLNLAQGIDLPRPVADVSWQDAVKEFKAKLEMADLRDSTKQFYKECLPGLTARFGHLSLLTITADAIAKVMHEMDCGDVRKRHLYICLCKIYQANTPSHYTRSSQPRWFDKLDEIKGYKAPVPDRCEMPKSLSKEQISKLRDAASPHMQLIIDVALQTGLRKSNVLEMQWAWINWREKLLTVPAEQSKNNSAIVIPLSNSLIARLRLFRRQGNIRLSVFDKTNFRKNWECLTASCGINATFHQLRHTVAINLVRENVPLPVVAAVLAHADIKTTMIYAKAVEQDKREAIEKLRQVMG